MPLTLRLAAAQLLPQPEAVPREPTIWEPTLGQDNRIDPRICRHTIYLWKPQWRSKQAIDTVRISVTLGGYGLRLTCRHPRCKTRSRAVRALRAALTEDGRHRQAAEIVRKLVDRIELRPVVRRDRKTLSVSLYGRLAGILAMATKAKASLDESDAPIRVTKLVAGVGFEPTTFRL